MSAWQEMLENRFAFVGGRVLALLIVLGLTAGGDLLAAEPSDSGVPAAVGEVQDVIYLAPGRPVFIRFHLQVNDSGFRAMQVDLANRLFASLDQDKNGYLDETEALEIPPPEQLTPKPRRSRVATKEIDVNPADARVSPNELARYVYLVSGYPFAIAAKELQQSQSVQLFSQLDFNGDAQLTADELRDARERLSKFDLDDDESFSLDELVGIQPFGDSSEIGIQEEVGNALGPFRAIIPGEPLGKIVAELIERYRSLGSKPRRYRIEPSELGLDPKTSAKYDRNADGLLDSTEMIYFLKDPVPHLELSVQLPHLRPGRPQISARPESPQRAEATIRQQRTTRLTLTLPSVEMELRVKSGWAMTYDTQQFYKQQFLLADSDQNGYLDQQEFATVNVPNADFEATDKDKDGMVVVDELVRLVNRQANSDQSQVVMTVAKVGRSVFESLDTNRDLRLNPRELIEAGRQLQGFDKNQDGTVTALEIDGQYQLTFEMGKPELFRRAPMRSNTGNNRMRSASSLSGPLWFQRMDLNRDGDVTQREFLGPRRDFPLIDTNRDGLISQGEAEAVGQSR